ncbi:MAG: nitroreductase family deazaflavin-dependent oxidoreductase [Candidatus Dormibacterales bacterium]
MSNSFGNFNRSLIEDLRANGGKPTGGPFKGREVLILTTTGARSGVPRENPLVYTRDGSHIVIVASKGGAPTHPSWYHNLVAHPEVKVELDGETFEARAHVATDAEYERLYKQHADINPTFHDYRARTTRKIPVILLERAGSN